MADEWQITMHHRATMIAAQYIFKNKEFAEAAWLKIIAAGEKDQLVSFEHFAGQSLVTPADFCEFTIGSWHHAMSQFGFMQESQMTAEIQAEVRAQQATRHLARFQPPQAAR